MKRIVGGIAAILFAVWRLWDMYHVYADAVARWNLAKNVITGQIPAKPTFNGTELLAAFAFFFIGWILVAFGYKAWKRGRYTNKASAANP